MSVKKESLSLLSLPVDVIRHAIFPLLEFKLLVSLDSALCETSQRNHYNNCLHGHLCETYYWMYSTISQWVRDRGMKISSAELTAAMDTEHILQFRSLYCSLKSIKLFTPIEEAAFSLFCSCIEVNSLVEISIYAMDKTWDEKILRIVLSRQSSLRKVTLKATSVVTDQTVLWIASHCPLLEYISLDCGLAKLDISVVKVLLSSCKHLCDIHVSGNAVSNEILQVFATHCKLFKGLGLSSCGSIDDAGLRTALRLCEQLESLTIHSCPQITAAGIAVCGRHCTRLTNSSFDGFVLNSVLLPFFAHTKGITQLRGPLCSDLVLRGAVHWRDLISIDLFKSDLVDAAVDSLARNCVCLQQLFLADCLLLTNASMVSLGRYAQSLEVLFITNDGQISDDGIVALCTGCPKLRIFYVKVNTHVTYVGAVAVARRIHDRKYWGFSLCQNVSSHDSYCAWLKAYNERIAPYFGV